MWYNNHAQKTTKGTDMRNDNIIAFRTREQLRKYLGIFSPQFKNNRWKMEFLGQMLFGSYYIKGTVGFKMISPHHFHPTNGVTLGL